MPPPRLLPFALALLGAPAFRAASMLRSPRGPSEAGLYIAPVAYNRELLGPAFSAPSAWYLSQWSASQQLNATDAAPGAAPGAAGPCGSGATLWHAAARDQLVCVQRLAPPAGGLALAVEQNGSALPCGAEFDSFIAPTDGAYDEPALKNLEPRALGGAGGVGASLRARLTLDLLAFAPTPRCGPAGACGPSGKLDYGYVTLGIVLGNAAAGATIFYQLIFADTRAAPSCPGSDCCHQWSNWFSVTEPLGISESIAFFQGADGGCMAPGAGPRSFDLLVGPRLLAVVSYAAAHFGVDANASAWDVHGLYVGAGMEGSTVTHLRVSDVDLVYDGPAREGELGKMEEEEGEEGAEESEAALIASEHEAPSKPEERRLQPQPPSWDAVLVPHSAETTALYGSACLDGSPGAFYYRPAASPSAAHKLKIHFQGGGRVCCRSRLSPDLSPCNPPVTDPKMTPNFHTLPRWCQSPLECLYRSQSPLGSSAGWPPLLSSLWVPGGVAFSGLMDGNATDVNPFGDWAFVWVPYCCGSSHTSDRSSPLSVNGSTLHFRGRALLDAQLHEMERLFGLLSSAEEVIVSGTSAGGVATYLHADVVRARMPAAARVVAVPDSGMFADSPFFPELDGPHVMLEAFATAMGPGLWNATLRGGAARCAADNADLPARCYFAQHQYKYVAPGVDGVFVANSQVDAANLGTFFNLTCSPYADPEPYPASCSAAETAALMQFGRDFLGNFSAARDASGPLAARDSFFIDSCFQHGVTCRAADWYDIRIGGRSANNTFFSWYTGGSPASAQDAPWPSDASCPPQVRTDGGPGPC